MAYEVLGSRLVGSAVAFALASALGCGIDPGSPTAQVDDLASGGARARGPRLLSPLSGSASDSRQPLFAFTPGSPRGTVQICADRACARVLASVDGDKGAAQPELP